MYSISNITPAIIATMAMTASTMTTTSSELSTKYKQGNDINNQIHFYCWQYASTIIHIDSIMDHEKHA